MVLLIFKYRNQLTAKVAKFYAKVTKKEKKEITQRVTEETPSFTEIITDMIFFLSHEPSQARSISLSYLS